MTKNFLAWFASGIILVVLTISGCNQQPTSPKIVQYKGEYICISLKEYINQYYKRIASGSAIPQDMDTLFGLSWLDGYVQDKDDVILVGKQNKLRPAYHGQDLFVNLQNVFDSASSPYCSLDPYPENIVRLNHQLNKTSAGIKKMIENCQNAIGGQQVVTGGVPANSRHARIMIYADYDMKKISQGLLKVPGIRSFIDRSMENPKNKSFAGASMSRFWLHIKESTNNQVYPNYNENDSIVLINECPVVVLTEKQYADAEGNFKDDVSTDDKDATDFAEEMSNRYGDLALQNLWFADLENMFRLQACLKAMKFKNVLFASGVNLASVFDLTLEPGNELPPSLPGLVNFKTTETFSDKGSKRYRNTRLFIVAGGVSQDMKIADNNLFYNEELKNSGKMIIKAKPNKKSVSWNVNLSE